MAPGIFIFGAGSYARILRQVAGSSGLTVSAFVVDPQFYLEDSFDGLPLYAWGQQSMPDPAAHEWLIAAGYRSMMARSAIARRLADAGAALTSVISPDASVARTATIGPGCVLFPGTVIEDFCEVGRNNVFWSGTIIAHETVIGGDNYFAPGVTLSGNCCVGSRCFFGTRASSIDGVRVGDDCHITASALLVDDASGRSRYQGVPARRVGSIDPVLGVQVTR